MTTDHFQPQTESQRLVCSHRWRVLGVFGHTTDSNRRRVTGHAGGIGKAVLCCYRALRRKKLILALVTSAHGVGKKLACVVQKQSAEFSGKK